LRCPLGAQTEEPRQPEGGCVGGGSSLPGLWPVRAKNKHVNRDEAAREIHKCKGVTATRQARPVRRKKP